MLNFAIAGGVVLLLAIVFISIYNSLVKKRIMVQEGWSGIGAFLQQRNDVIANLVETVKGYASHESKTLMEVTMWRNKSASATSVQDQSVASAGLMQAMSGFNVVSEEYPELKANTNFLELQTALSDLEEKIGQSRRYYNGTVRSYNQAIAVFPNNLLAGMFGFAPEQFFAEETAARTVPKVSF